MGRNFSLATLLLLTAIAALGAAVIRPVFVRFWSGGIGQSAVGPMTLLCYGAVAGMVFSVALAAFNRRGWGQVILGPLAGICIGAAAGAQMSLRLDAAALAAMPMMTIVVVLFIAARAR